MTGIHQHPVEVPGEIQGAIIVSQIDNGYPPVIGILAGLIIEI